MPDVVTSSIVNLEEVQVYFQKAIGALGNVPNFDELTDRVLRDRYRGCPGRCFRFDKFVEVPAGWP
jgi:hypothetical protein